MILVRKGISKAVQPAGSDLAGDDKCSDYQTCKSCHDQDTFSGTTLETVALDKHVGKYNEKRQKDNCKTKETTEAVTKYQPGNLPYDGRNKTGKLSFTEDTQHRQ